MWTVCVGNVCETLGCHRNRRVWCVLAVTSVTIWQEEQEQEHLLRNTQCPAIPFGLRDAPVSFLQIIIVLHYTAGWQILMITFDHVTYLYYKYRSFNLVVCRLSTLLLRSVCHIVEDCWCLFSAMNLEFSHFLELRPRVKLMGP